MLTSTVTSPSVSPTSMPSPTMVPASQPQQGGVRGYVQAAQKQGISSKDIYNTLKAHGYIDANGAISETKQSASPVNNTVSQIGSNLANTFQQGGANVSKDITNAPAVAKAAGGGQGAGAGGIVPDLLTEASTAGHVAGDVAGTAGGILGSVISPFLPHEVKQAMGDATKYVTDKVNSIPGMTPEIAKSLGDLFNTGSLLGGAKAEPAATGAAGAAAKTAANLGSNAVESLGETAVNVAKGMTNKLSDAATTITPNMQTLIERVKTDPTLASKTAADVQKYFKTANDAKGVTGASTPLDLAGGQFKSAMTKLRANMNTTGETMSSAVKPIAGAKVPGVGDILKHLQEQTAERLGAVYTPIADAVPELKGKSFAQSTAHLNDIIDGKIPSPFGEGEGPLQSAPGRESLITSPSDIKKTSDIHETLANLGENPTIQQIHDVVQRWQGDLYKAAKVGAQPIDSNVKGLMKQTIGMLNEKAKEASLGAEKEAGLTPGTYADAKLKYGQLAELQSGMSRRLGVNYKQAPSLIKKIFSPQNQGLNDAIKQLEKETGVPILDHATLADFAMRSSEDPRIRSLLEDAPLTSGSKTLTHAAVSKIFNVIKDHLNDPEGKALRQLAGNPKTSAIRQSISTSGHDYDAMIQSGDVPKESIFKSDGSLQPEHAEHVVSDMAGKLDHFKSGLGDTFKKTVDMSKPTVETLQKQALKLLK